MPRSTETTKTNNSLLFASNVYLETRSQIELANTKATNAHNIIEWVIAKKLLSQDVTSGNHEQIFDPDFPGVPQLYIATIIKSSELPGYELASEEDKLELDQFAATENHLDGLEMKLRNSNRSEILKLSTAAKNIFEKRVDKSLVTYVDGTKDLTAGRIGIVLVKIEKYIRTQHIALLKDLNIMITSTIKWQKGTSLMDLRLFVEIIIDSLETLSGVEQVSGAISTLMMNIIKRTPWSKKEYGPSVEHVERQLTKEELEDDDKVWEKLNNEYEKLNSNKQEQLRQDNEDDATIKRLQLAGKIKMEGGRKEHANLVKFEEKKTNHKPYDKSKHPQQKLSIKEQRKLLDNNNATCQALLPGGRTCREHHETHNHDEAKKLDSIMSTWTTKTPFKEQKPPATTASKESAMYTVEQVNAAVVAATAIERGKAMTAFAKRNNEAMQAFAKQQEGANYADYDEYSVMSDARPSKTEHANMAVADEHSVPTQDQLTNLSNHCALLNTVTSNHNASTEMMSIMSSFIAKTDLQCTILGQQIHHQSMQIQHLSMMIANHNQPFPEQVHMISETDDDHPILTRSEKVGMQLSLQLHAALETLETRLTKHFDEKIIESETRIMCSAAGLTVLPGQEVDTIWYQDPEDEYDCTSLHSETSIDAEQANMISGRPMSEGTRKILQQSAHLFKNQRVPAAAATTATIDATVVTTQSTTTLASSQPLSPPSPPPTTGSGVTIDSNAIQSLTNNNHAPTILEAIATMSGTMKRVDTVILAAIHDSKTNINQLTTQMEDSNTRLDEIDFNLRAVQEQQVLSNGKIEDIIDMLEAGEQNNQRRHNTEAQRQHELLRSIDARLHMSRTNTPMPQRNATSNISTPQTRAVTAARARIDHIIPEQTAHTDTIEQQGASPAEENWGKESQALLATTDNAPIKKLIDSGATSHFIASAEGTTILGPAKGSVMFGGNNSMTKQMSLRVHRDGLGKAVVVPGLTQELHSVSKYGSEGMDTLFRRGRAYVFRRDTEEIVQTGTERGGLYYCDERPDRSRTIEQIMNL